MSMFLYAFRERKLILDIKELISGQRMMTTYFRPGGVWRDVPVEFEKAVRDFIKMMPARIDEYEALLTKTRSSWTPVWDWQAGCRGCPPARRDRTHAACLRRELGSAQSASLHGV